MVDVAVWVCKMRAWVRRKYILIKGRLEASFGFRNVAGFCPELTPNWEQADRRLTSSLVQVLSHPTLSQSQITSWIWE